MNTADTKKTHAKARAVWTRGTLQIVQPRILDARIAGLHPGDGELFVVRVEREADAKRHHQLKWYYGYIIEQTIEYTGETTADRDLHFRSLFLPFDVATLSDISYEQMQTYNVRCEQYAAEVIGVVVSGPDDARHYRHED